MEDTLITTFCLWFQFHRSCIKAAKNTCCLQKNSFRSDELALFSELIQLWNVGSSRRKYHVLAGRTPVRTPSSFEPCVFLLITGENAEVIQPNLINPAFD